MRRTALLLAIPALALAGCAAPVTPVDNGTLRVLASTNVYGNIAEVIGGDLVTVTSLIASSAQDPHSFEASAQDQLAVSKAQVVIANGGGYDPFVDTLLGASGNDPQVITAAEVVGLPDRENEHLWYSLEDMAEVAEEIAEAFGSLDAAHADTFERNADAFVAELDALETRAEGIGSGQGVAITEPVPLYLLEAADFVNETPDEFSEAIEEGSDVPPLALQQTLELFSERQVALLAYNDQTSSPETERVREAAEQYGIPVVNFTETLPDGQTYLSWMSANLDALADAVQ